MKIKIEYWKSPKNKKWYFNAESRNNKIVLPSQAYVSEQGCLKTIKNIPKILKAAKWEVLHNVHQKEVKPGVFKWVTRFYFHGKARNGRIVIPSQSYKTRQGALKGIDRLKNAEVIAVKKRISH